MVSVRYASAKKSRAARGIDITWTRVCTTVVAAIMSIRESQLHQKRKSPRPLSDLQRNLGNERRSLNSYLGNWT